MRRKLYTFEWECDLCRTKVVKHDQRKYPDSPAGWGTISIDDWGTISIDDWGMTGYTKTLEVCEKCLAKHKAQEGK